MAEIEKKVDETTEKNETEVDSEFEDTEEETESEESEGESEDDSEKEKSEEKPKETDEARKARLERQLKQVNKKLGLDNEEKPKPKAKKSEEFDEGQLAYLTAKGIDNDEDIDFTRDELKKHGGTLRELLGNDYFQNKLKSRKEARVVLEATPTNSRRSGSSAKDTVEYEYAKYMKTGKLPADREMREKLVEMRLKKEKVDNEFTD